MTILSSMADPGDASLYMHVLQLVSHFKASYDVRTQDIQDMALPLARPEILLAPPFFLFTRPRTHIVPNHRKLPPMTPGTDRPNRPFLIVTQPMHTKDRAP